ncbi:MAG: 1-deoxy-D-xylulose-5-phosphate synthase [Oscillospiraceae bacterium]|nr:1-deoxy-D-xylulose-5-phosphate synthase [Oscillospiraceae bacterium]
MGILDELKSANEIKDMSIENLYKLCEDLRCFMVSNISKTGGHLASNLGVVEITVAIHNVFDTSKDRLIFDVGHQCYTHKILTGRRDGFSNLRGLGGISGFPNPDESEHDAFVSGHASTSVSVALGMARASVALGEDYSVIALIGDGALTGGLAYEGLIDAGHSGVPLIVILNDNEMSITENVGGLSNHLARLRVRPYYLTFKKIYRKTIAKIPLVGKGVTKFFRRIKGLFRSSILPSSMFENMGFTYFGPADGHNIKEVCRLLKVARDMKKPIIIHLKTTKGKGYKFAEEKPEIYHGVPCFNIGNGEPTQAPSKTFASAFGDTVLELAKKDKKILTVTAAMQSGTGLDEFAGALPKQFFDVGIAEGHAVAMAGALAKQGMLPVCAIYATFIQRAYDMVFHDVCLSNLHVVFAVDRAGLVADDGPTHQGIFDVGIFLQMPNMTVLCPSGISEMKHMLKYAIYDVKGPVAIRYPRGGCECYVTQGAPYEPMLLKEGKEIAILTYGRLTENVMEAAELLSEQGTMVSVIKLTQISGDLMSDLSDKLKDISRLYVVEECVEAGSVAQKLALEISASDLSIQVMPINLGNQIAPPATAEELMSMYGLDAKGIAERVL